jgi:hypothetical protein
MADDTIRSDDDRTKRDLAAAGISSRSGPQAAPAGPIGPAADLPGSDAPGSIRAVAEAERRAGRPPGAGRDPAPAPDRDPARYFPPGAAAGTPAGESTDPGGRVTSADIDRPPGAKPTYP